MSIISKPNTFSEGATIIASEHNDNFDTLYSEFNGNIDNSNIKSSAAIAASKLNLTTISQAITFTGNNTFAGTTIANLGTVTTVDINGGTIDGVDGSFTTLDFSTAVSDGTTTIDEFSTDGTFAGNSDTALPTEKAVKTYIDANGSLTPTVFELHGAEGTFLGTGAANDTTTGGHARWKNNGTGNTYQTVAVTKFKKISGIDTVTIYVRAWVTSAGGATADCKVTIGGQTGTSSNFDAVTSPAWQSSFTVDVSGLSNGTIYDVTIQLRETSGGANNACFSDLIAFGS